MTTLWSGAIKKSIYKINCKIKIELFKKFQIKYTFNEYNKKAHQPERVSKNNL